MSQTTLKRIDSGPIETVERADTVAERMRGLVGQTYRLPDYYEVGREKIREFARAVQNENPAHRDDVAARELGYDTMIAPITFVSVVGRIALENLFEHVIDDYDPAGLLQIDQQFIMHNQIHSGDRLTSDLQLESFRQIAGSDIIVIRNDLSDHNSREMVTTRTTFMARTGAILDPEMAAFVKKVMASPTRSNRG